MHHSSPISPSWPRSGARMLLAAASALLLACGPKPGDIDGTASTGSVEGSSGSTATTGGDGMTSEPSPTSTSTSTSTSGVPGTGGMTSSGGVDSCGFICEPDLPSKLDDCPGTQQLEPECPAGHKCTIDGSLGETHCVEIAPAPRGLYEPCKALGDQFSGLDDCGLGLLCWGVNQRGEGTCIGLCDGPPDACVCADPAVKATWCQSCVVGLCIPDCDPLLQNCPHSTDACYPINDGFTCTTDASGDAGQANDPCEFINTCAKGLACIDAAIASAACDPQVAGCCQPFCAFPGGACPNPDQSCAQWFEPGQVPPGSEEIGICIIKP